MADPTHSDERRSRLEKVQSSDTAEVYRYAIDINGTGEVLYLKKHPHRSVTDAVKHLFRPSRAKRAFKAGLELQKHQFETPQIAAFLQKKYGLFSWEDVLVTRGIVNAVDLPAAFINAGRTATGPLHLRRSMISELGKTIARMHAVGICHGDLRAGNVFVRKVPEGFGFIFIDNERTLKYPVLPFRLRLKNLVQLNLTRADITRTDRMRFLTAYCQIAGQSRQRCKYIARKTLISTTARLKKRAVSHTGFADGKLEDHWAVQGARFGCYDGYFLTSFCKGDSAAVFLQQIEHLTETSTLLKNDTAARVVRCRYNGRDIVIKRYNHQGVWHSLRHTIKGSRAKKCWHFGHLLTKHHIACAEPIGIVEKRKLGLIWESYIINAFIEGPDIQEYFRCTDAAASTKAEVMEKVRQMTAQLGENGLIHNDLKPSNLLIARDDDPVLIDLDSMKSHRNRRILEFYWRKMDRKITHRIASLLQDAERCT